MTGTLELLCGPSGVGKSSNLETKLSKPMTYTTRSPRNEKDAKTRRFVDDFTFEKLRQTGEIVIAYKFDNHKYGFSKEVIKALSAGINVSEQVGPYSAAIQIGEFFKQYGRVDKHLFISNMFDIQFRLKEGRTPEEYERRYNLAKEVMTEYLEHILEFDEVHFNYPKKTYDTLYEAFREFVKSNDLEPDELDLSDKVELVNLFSEALTLADMTFSHNPEILSNIKRMFLYKNTPFENQQVTEDQFVDECQFFRLPQIESVYLELGKKKEAQQLMMDVLSRKKESNFVNFCWSDLLAYLDYFDELHFIKDVDMSESQKKAMLERNKSVESKELVVRLHTFTDYQTIYVSNFNTKVNLTQDFLNAQLLMEAVHSIMFLEYTPRFIGLNGGRYHDEFHKQYVERGLLSQREHYMAVMQKYFMNKKNPEDIPFSELDVKFSGIYDAMVNLSSTMIRYMNIYSMFKEDMREVFGENIYPLLKREPILYAKNYDNIYSTLLLQKINFLLNGINKIEAVDPTSNGSFSNPTVFPFFVNDPAFLIEYWPMNHSRDNLLTELDTNLKTLRERMNLK